MWQIVARIRYREKIGAWERQASKILYTIVWSLITWENHVKNHERVKVGMSPDWLINSKHSLSTFFKIYIDSFRLGMTPGSKFSSIKSQIQNLEAASAQ